MRLRHKRIDYSTATHCQKIFSAWRARRHYRRELRRLLAVGPYMIADIGLTLQQTREEMIRPFWQS